jgi:hypothetical protein
MNPISHSSTYRLSELTPLSRVFNARRICAVPPGFATNVRREMRAMRAAAQDVNRRLQLKAIHALALGFAQGQIQVDAVCSRLQQIGQSGLDAAWVKQEFMSCIERLHKLRMQPWDRYAVKVAVSKRLARSGAQNQALSLQPLREKYGDEAVNYAIGEELVLQDKRLPHPRMARYTILRKDLDQEIQRLRQALAG